MKTEKVKKLTVEQRFLYWIKERHQIYLRRKLGNPKPWTTDEVLQNYFFTNPYRENDKVTNWFRTHIRDPLTKEKNNNVLFATVAFRWFNKPEPTGNILLERGLLERWNTKRAIKYIGDESRKQAVFTGAYMIKAGNGEPGCKVPNVCNAIEAVWKDRKRLVQVCKDTNSLESIWKELCQFMYLGPFMSYEVVTDLRWTHLLNHAPDRRTWANPGPGCWRGLARMNGLNIKGRAAEKVKNPQLEMQRLMKMVNRKLPFMPKFEMREVEHSLCEFDKYERLLWKEGRSKRVYDGR